MRHLATVQVIKDIRPIEGADRIQVADVLGWHVVIKKDEFKVGDKCIYCEIDSIMPDRPEFAFLKDSKGKMKRIQTARLRGVLSQGICFPTSILKARQDITLGMDVTEELGIIKYEPPEPKVYVRHGGTIKYKYSWIPKAVYSLIKRYNLMSKETFTDLFVKVMSYPFPAAIPKTDETRVQILQELLDKYKGTECYVTEKVDGSSFTVFNSKGKLHICSRNYDLVEDPENLYWKAALELDLKKILKGMPDNFVLQGELCGPGIQSNRYKFEGYRIFWFNVFDKLKDRYLDYEDFLKFIQEKGLTPVEVVKKKYILPNNIDQIIKDATGKSHFADIPREGIVIRPLMERKELDLNDGLVHNRVSFKAINNDFLEKFKDA